MDRADWYGRLVDALDYVETHMDGEIRSSEVARVACSSPFHFQRMFHVLAGVTLAEYVRNRRLTLAAQELASTQAKVGEVAVKYGYESPEAFCKAFRRAHGIAPSAARKSGVTLRVYPRLSIQITTSREREMEYNIVESPSFKILGKGLRMNTKDNQQQSAIPQFWQQVTSDGTFDRLCASASGGGTFAHQGLGVCTDFDPEMQSLLYVIGFETTQPSTDPEFEVREVPAATWAVFESVGALPDAIQSVWRRIFAEFFPSTGYQHAPDVPDIEAYPEGSPFDPDYHCQVWVPVVRK